MSQTASAKPSRTPEQQRRRVLAAALVGTTIEWYDFYLYAQAAALVFGTTFFPETTPAVALISSFATYGVGFLARPLGGIVAGHLGDRIGRKQLLVGSLLLMGVATLLIGVLPTYAQIGIWAVVALVVLRLAQGLSAGAEWGGSALLSVEHAPDGRRGFFGSFTQMGSAGGLLLATASIWGVQGILGTEAFQEWAWRIPFLASAVLVVIGLVIRLGVEDAPEFRKIKEAGAVRRLPVVEVLRRHPRGVLVTIGLRLVQPAWFSILTVYSLTYLADARGDSAAGIQSLLIVGAVSLVSTPLWGWLSDRVGRRRIAIGAAIGIGVAVWPFFAFLDHGPLAILWLVFLVGMNLLHDAIYGPQAAWFAEQFPTDLRYSGVSLGYQVGSIFSNGLTPLLAVVLVELAGGSPWILCVFIGLYAVLTTIAAIFAKDGGADDVELAASGDVEAELDALVDGEQAAVRS
ncbi:MULTISPECIES: MFS transporter [unclassified Agrococcus]|uniref:MFS transporter n=1 Tax=unclassified Agrococcus TaxID=2615065 RepID=UPI00360B9C62